MREDERRTKAKATITKNQSERKELKGMNRVCVGGSCCNHLPTTKKLILLFLSYLIYHHHHLLSQ